MKLPMRKVPPRLSAMDREETVVDDTTDHTAAEALASARQAQAQGASQARRPAWYHLALGVSLFVALASFTVGSPAVGVPLGLVIGPVALEMLARQQTGAAPLQSYGHPSVRGLATTAAVTVATLFAAGILLEKGAGLTGAAVVCGVLVLVVTVVLGRRLDSRRAAGQAGTSLR